MQMRSNHADTKRISPEIWVDLVSMWVTAADREKDVQPDDGAMPKGQHGPSISSRPPISNH